MTTERTFGVMAAVALIVIGGALAQADGDRLIVRSLIGAPAAGYLPFGQETRLSDRLLVDVASTEPWTDTGLVVAAGDRIQIRAWGTVKFDGGRDGATVTPRGVPGPAGGCAFVAPDPKVPGYSLIANIAPGVTLDGHAVFVGTQWTGTLPIAGTSATRGKLLLGFNDKAVMCDRSGYDSWGFRNDNAGVFVVDISVSRGR